VLVSYGFGGEAIGLDLGLDLDVILGFVL